MYVYSHANIHIPTRMYISLFYIYYSLAIQRLSQIFILCLLIVRYENLCLRSCYKKLLLIVLSHSFLCSIEYLCPLLSCAGLSDSNWILLFFYRDINWKQWTENISFLSILFILDYFQRNLIYSVYLTAFI